MIYDDFQKKAIDYIKQNKSVIVSAPTGTGKTVIAEYVINDSLSKNRSVVYTAPIKALSNQKFREFSKAYGDKIGILTGDVSINPEASILIMTTEILRNKILEGPHTLERYSWVIFDEIHYLDDYERGTVWEESLIFLPHHMNVLALSATIPNIEEFTNWIRSIHKKDIATVIEDRRVVPLHFYYQCQGRVVDGLKDVKRYGYNFDRSYGYRSPKGKRRFGHMHQHPNKPVNLISHLEKYNRLPCIYFSFARKRCEYLAEHMSQFNFLSPEESERIRGLYLELCEKYDVVKDGRAMSLLSLIEKGTAYHHAGMLPTLKEIVERLFTSRLIKVIFTTETFSLGINMPARTVVFDELRKYHGRYFGVLKTRDFYQMAGRAGRRGIDHEGFVYSRVNTRDISFQELNKIVYGTPENVRSRFNASYGTILNLYEKFGESLYDIYPKSFHYYQEKEKYRKRAIELLRSKVTILKDLGYIHDGALTKKGSFASKVYGYELSLSELCEQGLLEHLSAIELGILCIGLVFEPRKGSIEPHLSRTTKDLSMHTNKITKVIHAREKRLNIRPLSKEYHFHLAPCLEAWMKGQGFDEILRYTGSDEGEIIRYFRMAIQILREILDTPASLQLKTHVKKAIELINRGEVDAEKQLRS
ncbi:MAG: DEAD/DEAH box helicase [Candidatus Omnitrophica bacterium]|nr:DEAD/DEAH box helicase [Candidatus Omnitrophota bacterium]